MPDSIYPAQSHKTSFDACIYNRKDWCSNVFKTIKHAVLMQKFIKQTVEMFIQVLIRTTSGRLHNAQLVYNGLIYTIVSLETMKSLFNVHFKWNFI